MPEMMVIIVRRENKRPTTRMVIAGLLRMEFTMSMLCRLVTMGRGNRLCGAYALVTDSRTGAKYRAYAQAIARSRGGKGLRQDLLLTRELEGEKKRVTIT